MQLIRFFGLVTAICLATNSWAATTEIHQAELREIYQQLIEINTTLSAGSCTEAAQAMAGRLKAAGIPQQDIHVIVPPDWPTQGNLIASIPGTSTDLGPILLLAHIDVVEARREDWERDPFKLVEENGYFYARGAWDDKAMAAIFVDALARYKRTGYEPERTIKLALTCGEETPNTFNGVSYLLEHYRELIEASFALNEGGGGYLDSQDRRLYNGVQAGEKLYQDYRLEITNPGGHSSRPVKDNAIYRLAAALQNISAYDFPIEFNDTTRAYFDRMVSIKSGQVAEDLKALLQTPPPADALARITADPSFNSVLHTTCVATMIDGGHAPNALPQRAGANVNCRIFPGHSQEEIRKVLEQVVNDAAIAVSFAHAAEDSSAPPPLTREILTPIETVSEQMWPGLPVLPFMVAGGTDGRFLTPAGIPTYGVSGMFKDPAKVNAHGLNEKMPVASLYESQEFLDRLIRIYAGGE
jgi:acetylornithine deacetylase/succinyl-diaminopimelate desuccinylase-like protein